MPLGTPLQRWLPALALTIMPMIGCDAPEAGALDDPGMVRGGLGKADAPGSCFDDDDAPLCGGAGLGRCHCDEECAEYGDCCSDYAEACECAPLTCDEIPQACGEVEDGCGGVLECGACCDQDTIVITGTATDVATSIDYPFTLRATADEMAQCRDSDTLCYARRVVGELSIPDHPNHFNGFGVFDGTQWDSYHQRAHFDTYYRHDPGEGYEETLYVDEWGAKFELHLYRMAGESMYSGWFERADLLGYRNIGFELEGTVLGCAPGI